MTETYNETENETATPKIAPADDTVYDIYGNPVVYDPKTNLPLDGTTVAA